MTQHTPRRRSAPGLACLASVALGLPIALVACWPGAYGDGSAGSSSSGPAPTTDPPVIQSLDMDQSALKPTAQDTYIVSGSITYTDDDDVVTAVQVQVPVIGHTYTVQVADPVSTAAGQPFYFTVSADPPLGGAGPTNYIVSLVNQSGAISAGVEKSMDLE